MACTWRGSASPRQRTRKRSGIELGLVDLGLRNRRAADAARRLRHERERHHGYAREVLARLLVGDVDQLREAPLRREHRERRLEVHARVAGAHRQRVRLGRRQAGVVVAVDEQSPDLLVRHVADELLDVDSAIPKRAALAVGLGDRRVERDYSLKSGRDLDQRHRRRILTRPVVRLATQDDAADVARLMIGFRDWQGKSEPADDVIEAIVRRLLADPNTEFLLGRQPARRRLPAPLPALRLDRNRRLLPRGPVRRGGRARVGAWPRARGRGAAAGARAGLHPHRPRCQRGERPGAGALQVGRLRQLVRRRRRQRPVYAAASLTSSTSSPTAMRPGWTMSARRPARCTIPLSTPG